MDIPPLLKISTNLLNKFRTRSTSLLNTKRYGLEDSINIKGVNYNWTNDNKLFLTSDSGSIDSLLNLNLDNSIDFIHRFLTNSQFCSKLSVNYNLNLLSNNISNPKKLKSKDIKAINYRILSIDDHLNLTHLSKLIFSLTNSDKRFSGLVFHLLKLFLDKKYDLVEYYGNKEYLFSQFVVLSSLLVFKRNNITSNVKLIEGSSLTNYSSEAHTSLENLPELEFKLLKNIEHLLSNSQFSLSNDECLLFLSTLSLTTYGNDTVVKSLLSHINMDKMSLGEMCTFLHTLSLLPVCDQSTFNDLTELTLERITDAVNSGVELPSDSFPKLFHYFYLTGELEHKLFDTMSDMLVERNIEFESSTDFYRVSFPLAISRMTTSPKLSKWLLNELASKCDVYIKDVSNFLFVLMSVASSIKIDYKRPKLNDHLSTMDIETDIYEKALIYLNESDKGTYFPSERSALLYLFERALELVEVCDQDQFVQLIQALTHKLVKINTLMKLKLLNECKKRVNTVGVGGIVHVLQFIVWMYGSKNPDLISTVTMYMERIIADIVTFNVGDHSLLQTSNLHTDSFLTDIKSLANILYILDWSNIHSADLANEVYSLVCNSNYRMLEEAELRELAHTVHYIAISNTNLKNLDPLYIIIRESLRKAEHISARELIMILESMIINAQHTRHKTLLREIEAKAISVCGPMSTIETLSNTLSRLTDIKYTLKENGTGNYTIQLST